MMDHGQRPGESYGAGGGAQQPPVWPPVPPVLPSGGASERSSRRVLIGVLLFMGALLIIGLVVVSEGVSVEDYDTPAIRHEVRATIDNLNVA